MATDNWKLYKPVLFRRENWQLIRDLADVLSEERGSRVALSATVMESVKFFRENRYMAGTPGGKVVASTRDITGTTKGIN